MQEAADALMANQGAIVNSIIERTRTEVPEPSADARCCAHVKCPSGSLCCCIDEAPGASACVCLPAIAGISDGPNVDCPEHGERLDVAVLREAWVHYTAVGASVEVQEQKAAVFDRWIAGPRVEPSCDYEAGYAEGFHHGVSTPRGSAENDREQGEPSDALPPLWRCPSCPVILVGPQIDGAREHTLEHESENP
ncbi:hypothetical protein [Microbacterium sp. HSID17254]|uniref:hypothetical protein n=1 Tax=Microbacterium sp. HSID17254 TaxID=2419509 RepID=UPI000F873E48|nr:hypothetical protein [Microbacterium sp. HSID17254]